MVKKNTDVVVKNDHPPAPLGKFKGVFRIPAVLVSCTVNSVMRMPDLKEPVADPDYLIEHNGTIACVLYSWSYCYRRFEYAVDPFRKGFLAWLRLLFAFGFFLFMPVAILVGLCYGIVLVLSHLGGVVGEALALLKSVSLLLLGIIGVALLGYLTYIVIMVLMAKPVKLPKFMVAKESEERDNDPEIEE